MNSSLTMNNERPDSFLGYFVEAPRAIYHIISDDSIGKVRIENFDDISIFDYNGKIQKLEQIKYKSPCILTDYSKDLWNTLYNWFCVIENIREDDICCDIKFVIYSWDKCEIGNLANEFLNIKVKNNFNKIWEKQEKYFKEKDDTNEIKKYFNKLNTNKKLLRFILNAFYIEQPIKSSSEDFMDMLINKYGKTFKSINNFNIYIKGRFGLYLENPKLKTEKVIEITRQQFDFYKDRYDRLNAYELVDSLNIKTDKIENLKESLMVKQLEEVNLSDLVEPAIRDYIAWEILCTDCTADGYVNEQDINQIYYEAKSEWKEHKNYLRRQNQEYDGADLYYMCCNKGENLKPKRFTINGSQKRVTRGIYNTLANKPVNHNYSVGWHYQYEDKFKDFYENNI